MLMPLNRKQMKEILSTPTNKSKTRSKKKSSKKYKTKSTWTSTLMGTRV